MSLCERLESKFKSESVDGWEELHCSFETHQNGSLSLSRNVRLIVNTSVAQLLVNISVILNHYLSSHCCFPR